jgi:heparosan-N-sulfate-glucuronate 5-epimerase
LVAIGEQQVNYPVTVSKYAHDLYANYRSSGNVDVLDKFYINANWLRDNCVYTKYGFCSWRTEPAYTPYETGTDWPSAMAQGQAISVMISAYSLTQDTNYLKVAQDAMAAFFYPANVKGVKSDWDGGVWYEEYASENPAHVLNGFIVAMAGIYDAVELLDNESAKIAFDLGIENLKTKLTRYDVDFTSLYDQNDQQLRFANANANAKARSLDGYHELHILQLAWLYQKSSRSAIFSYV